MNGKILDYNIQNCIGIILAEDGNRYNFKSDQWRSNDSIPQKNTELNFMVANGEATEIYATKSADTSSQYGSTQAVQTSTAAVFSLVFGISGLFLDWWLFGIPSIIAIITGHIAKSSIALSNGKLGGSGMATAGLFLGYIVILLYLLVVLVFASFIVSLTNM